MHDCCSNIGEAYVRYGKRGGLYKEAILIFATILCLGTLLYAIYLGKYSGELFISLYGRE